jgi:curved DNA-binding protein CbpA
LLKNYYELLELAPTATPEEIKKTFRQQIARYHPDKVHHLGKEFQDMAAIRAAELTEAYRVLSHEERRAEYDAVLQAAGGASASTATPPAGTSVPPAQPPPPPSSETRESAPSASGDTAHAPAAPKEIPKQFREERASRDMFVRSAILDRFRQALLQVAGNAYDESEARGFDISCSPKSKMFVRQKGARLLGRFVGRVDAASVAEAWDLAGKLGLRAGDEVCIILMATDVAPAKELAGAIAEQRRRPLRGVKVTLIPVNASIWHAHMPTDAPEVAKNLLDRLRNPS